MVIRTAGVAHHAPGSQTWGSRRHSSKAAVAIAKTPKTSIAVRWGAENTARRNSMELPSPKVPNKIGKAQHDAVARPASNPPVASNTAPTPVGFGREGFDELLMSRLLVWVVLSSLTSLAS